MSVKILQPGGEKKRALKIRGPSPMITCLLSVGCSEITATSRHRAGCARSETTRQRAGSLRLEPSLDPDWLYRDCQDSTGEKHRRGQDRNTSDASLPAEFTKSAGMREGLVAQVPRVFQTDFG